MAMQKRKIISICAIISIIVMVIVITLHVINRRRQIEEEEARKAQYRQLMTDLGYADTFGMNGYIHIKVIIANAIRDQNFYDRVEFYDEQPDDFAYNEINDGVVKMFPSEKTPDKLDQFNWELAHYETDITKYGFYSEITMYDLVHRYMDVEKLWLANPWIYIR